MNQRQIHRVDRQDWLSLWLSRPRRDISAANRKRQPATWAAIEIWSTDFVSDVLFDGHRLRALTAADELTCEALMRGAQGTIRVDNGPGFILQALRR